MCKFGDVIFKLSPFFWAKLKLFGEILYFLAKLKPFGETMVYQKVCNMLSKVILYYKLNFV